MYITFDSAVIELRFYFLRRFPSPREYKKKHEKKNNDAIPSSTADRKMTA